MQQRNTSHICTAPFTIPCLSGSTQTIKSTGLDRGLEVCHSPSLDYTRLLTLVFRKCYKSLYQ